MLHVELSGTPYQIGYQHGSLLRPLVDGIVYYEARRYEDKMTDHSEIESMCDMISDRAPELIEELRGISEGAHIPFELLMRVNIRSLSYCSVVAFPDAEEGPLLGKNLDFPEYAFIVLMTIRPDSGIGFTQAGCAGTVASYGGVNAKGLAMGHAAVLLDTDPDRTGMPLAFLRRLPLQNCSNTEEAIELVANEVTGRRGDLVAGDNMVFLDANRNAKLIEKQPQGFQIIEPDNDNLWTVNAFSHPGHSAMTKNHQRQLGRYLHIGQLLDENREVRDRAMLESILSNTEGEFPVCRDSTQLSYIVNCHDRSFRYVDGYPKPGKYREIDDDESIVGSSREL